MTNKCKCIIHRYFAICHPVYFQSARSNTDPWIDIVVAFISGIVIQVPHAFANQITDPSCWTDHLTHVDTINLTVYCPCNNDENDVRPMCISTHNCPVIVEGLFDLYAYLKYCRKGIIICTFINSLLFFY